MKLRRRWSGAFFFSRAKGVFAHSVRVPDVRSVGDDDPLKEGAARKDDEEFLPGLVSLFQQERSGGLHRFLARLSGQLELDPDGLRFRDGLFDLLERFLGSLLLKEKDKGDEKVHRCLLNQKTGPSSLAESALP
jgi:hypothetical protein